jgi:hypothetical protein
MPEDQTAVPEFKRDEDFTTLYANNTQFESSVWDLKIIFGQLDQMKKPAVIQQHTAMTLSWPSAKIAAYYLLVNVILYQQVSGPVQLRADIIPKRPDPSDPSLDEAGKKMIEYLAWVHDQFFSDHPYIPPSLTGGVDAPKPTE